LGGEQLTNRWRPGPTISVVFAALLMTVGLAVPQASATDGAASRYLPVGPIRLADTRAPARGGFTKLDVSTIRVPVAGRPGVPGEATAAVLTITATQSRGGGYISVYPAGSARPDTSTLNLNGWGETVANTTLIPLGGGGVDVYASIGVHLLVDVAGVFVPAGGSAARVFDSRTSGRTVAPNSTVRVARPGFIPADASAVVANLTVTTSNGEGFWTAWAAGSARPDASVLNTEGPGQTRAALTIVPMSAQGFDVYASIGGHLLVDIAGYFTGAGAPNSSEGLFVPITPERALDTRRAGYAVGAGTEVEFASPRLGAALVYNLTSTGAVGAGFVTAHPAGTVRPETSNLNAPSPGYTVANLAVTTQSTRGVALYSAGGEHLMADVSGYFTGSPVAATLPPPPASGAPPGCVAGDVERINAVRAAVGLGGVLPDVQALKFACEWSKHMSDTKTFSHSAGPARTQAVGGCGSGENIAYSSGNTDLFQLWIDSPPHYQNMIFPRYTHAAIGYYTGPDGTYGTTVLVIRC
jgi:hypothetical protein